MPQIQQKSLCLLLAALLVMLIFPLPTAGSATENRAAYTDYRNIPGVTEEEIAAIEAIKAKYDKLSYGMLDTTETFLREDGSIGGYSALFAGWMTDLFGITFDPAIYDWSDLITGFESGTIDFTGELTATPERRMKYHMTGTFTERTIVAFRLPGGEAFADIAKVRPLRYAFLDGSTTGSDVASVSPYDIVPIYVATEDEATRLIYAGEVDAFLGEEHSAAAFPENFSKENIYPVVYSPISFSTARNELAPIISVLDKYLQNGAFYQLIELYNEGSREYLKYKLYSRLTSAEQAFLDTHQKGGEPVWIVAEHDNYPTCFYNMREDEWQGIAIDVLSQIHMLTGLEFEVANGPTETWADIFPRLESGEVSMVTELI